MAGMNPKKLTSAPEGFEYYRVCDRDGVCRVVRGSKQALNLTVDSSDARATTSQFRGPEWP